MVQQLDSNLRTKNNNLLKQKDELYYINLRGNASFSQVFFIIILKFWNFFDFAIDFSRSFAQELQTRLEGALLLGKVYQVSPQSHTDDNLP